MRKYQPIWEAVKQNSNASLAAPIISHRRIIKAVRKEKVKDAGWRLMKSEEGKRYKLKEKIDGKLITFYLVDISPIAISSL